MATILGNAYVRIRPDTAGFQADLDNKVGGSLKKIAGMAGAAIGALGIGSMVKQTIDLAANAEQSIGGVQAVFKNYANTVLSSSKAADRTLGLSANSYRELATVIGSQLKNAGVPLDQLGGKTDDLITQGADLAAMFGGTTQEAVNALSSALKGEMDPIERYGISLNDAALKAEALSLGVYSGTGNLDANAKAMAVMSLVTKQGADSQGAFGREADTAAGRAQRAAAQWENLKTSLGERLLPAWSALMDFVGKVVLPGLSAVGTGIDKVVGFFGSLYDIIVKGDFTKRFREIFGVEEDSPLVGALLKVHDGFVVVRDFVKDNLTPILAGLGAAVAVIAGPAVIGAIGSLIGLVGGALAGAFGLLLSPVALVALAVGGLVAIFVKAYQDSEPLRDAVQKLKDAFSVFFDAFDAANGAGGIQGFFDGLKAGIEAAWPMVKEAFAEMGSALWTWIQDNIGPALAKLGEFIAAIGAWIWNTGLPTLGAFLYELGSALVDWIGPRIVPMLEKLGELLVALGDWVWNTGLPWLGEHLAEWGQAFIDWIGPMIPPLLVKLAEFLGAAVTWIVDEGIPWLWDTLTEMAGKLVEWIAPQIPGLLGKLGEFLGTAVGWILGTGIPLLIGALLKLSWELITWVAPRIPGLLAEFLGLIGTVVAWIFTDGLPMLASALWELGTSAISSVWESIQNSPLVTKISEIFQGVVDTIKSIWDTVTDKVKEPVRIVVRFINDKIIDNLNKVTSVFGLDIPNIPLNFHTGGIVPGYTPGRDTQIAAVSGGEAVMRPEWTRAIGPSWINAANQAARMGGVSGVKDFLRSGGAGFHTGGIVPRESGGPLDVLGDVWDATGGRVVTGVGNAIEWSADQIQGLLAKGAAFAVRQIMAPIGGWITDNIGNEFVSKSYKNTMAELATKIENWGKDEDDKAAGAGPDAPAPGGPPGSGFQALFNTIKAAFPDARMNSGFRSGDPGYHGRGLAVDLGKMGVPGGSGNSYMAAMNRWIYDNYPNSRELIYNGSGDDRPNLKNGRDFAYFAGTQAQHKNHVHWVYDDGGILEPGLTTVDNRSGKPEAVFTNEEFEVFRQIVAGGGAAPIVGGNLILQVDPNASVRDQMESAMFELRRIKRGGGIR